MKQEHSNQASQASPKVGKVDDEGDPRLNASSSSDHPSKKEQILQLHQDGITDVAEVAYLVDASPSYVAEVLRQAGLLTGYFDLYTTTASEQNIYSRYFRNILAFKNVEAAQQSIEKIDRLYSYFERIGDRAGQHHAMLLALTGKNRARWSNKLEEAKIFSDWLAAH
ncbi:MAG: hypothetical protein AB1757_16975 [Acidobacteriota bacterium]